MGSRYPTHPPGGLAQLAEQWFCKPQVVGSNPTATLFCISYSRLCELPWTLTFTVTLIALTVTGQSMILVFVKIVILTMNNG